MKTIFDHLIRQQLVERIHSLDRQSKPVWGKMNVYQMTRHCTIWNDWVLGTDTNFVYKQAFLGRIFGKMALTSNTKDDKPMGKNMPAGKDFIVVDKDGDVDANKAIWSKQIARYGHYSNDRFIHDFFGKMTIEQIGVFAYKHTDHHLRQFNA
jgi:hypothetical protein